MCALAAFDFDPVTWRQIKGIGEIHALESVHVVIFRSIIDSSRATMIYFASDEVEKRLRPHLENFAISPGKGSSARWDGLRIEQGIEEVKAHIASLPFCLESK